MPVGKVIVALADISNRRDMDALAELEAAEVASPARREVLELIAEVRKDHDRKRDYEPTDDA